MTKFSEITSLFSSLASNAGALDPTATNEDDEDLAITISNLNRSLNLSETQPSTRVLDTALSLMCFTAPQVFQSVFDCTVKTIVAVLSSSIECKVIKIGKNEVLRVGGSICRQDCAEIIEACVDVLEKLEGHRGDLSLSMVHAALHMVVLASRFKYTLGSSAVLDVKTVDGWKLSFQKLLAHVPKESCISRDMPVRLLCWYLDPALLKHNMSQILQEVNKRPFLCLSMAFSEMTEWHSILISLTLAPSLFIEARALLHNWYLLTGLASVLRLQIQLVSLVLDIVSRPMSWGLSMETGSKMPFCDAYFPYKQKTIRILAGPLSWENFQQLVQKISRLVSQGGKDYNGSSEQGVLKMELVDHKSLWATAINFPDWFLFACLLLFSAPDFQGIAHLKYMIHSTDKSYDEEVPYCAAAARYIAWILDPVTESNQDLLVDYLTKLSGLWTSKRFSSGKCYQASRGCKEESEIELVCLENRILKYDNHSNWIWLKEFHDVCVRYCRQVTGFASVAAQISQGDCSQQSRLIRMIPLGILIGFLDSVDEVGCELFLHYAATGTILKWTETQIHGLKQNGRICEWQEESTTWSQTCTAEEAVAGASVVFDLTDVTEKMTASLFENEERGLKFLHGMKLKVGNYLLKCVKRLLHFKADEAAKLIMYRDLVHSLVRWERQGQDPQDYKDLEDVIDALKGASAFL
nr:uncharacterized protein LOC113691970 isoform X1 [Coffea arabica]